MSKIENIIKSKLDNFQSSNGAGADDLWSSISTGIAAESAATKKKRPIYFWFSIAGLFLTGTSAVIYYSGLNSSPEKARTESGLTTPSATKKDHKKEITAHSEEGVFNPIEANTETNNQNEILNTESIQNEIETATLETSTSSIIPSKAIKQDSFTDTHKTSEATKSPIDLTQENSHAHSGKQNDVLGNKKQTLANFTEVIQRANPNKTLSEKPMDELEISMMNRKNKALVLNPILNNLRGKKQDLSQKTIKSRYVRVYAGNNLKSTNYSGSSQLNSYVSDLNSSITKHVGQSFGVMTDIKKFNSFKVMSGLEYHQFTDEFNKVIVSDTMVVFNEQTELNDFVIETRSVRHFNKLSVLTIPVELHKTKSFGRFSADLGVGVSYSLVLNQEGRKLSGIDGISDFSNSEKYYSNYVSLRLRALGGYSLTDNLSMETGLLFGLQKHNSAGFSAANSNSNTLTPHIGFSFKY